MVQQVKLYIDCLPMRVLSDEVKLSQLSQQCEPSAVHTGAQGTTNQSATRLVLLCIPCDSTVHVSCVVLSVT